MGCVCGYVRGKGGVWRVQGRCVEGYVRGAREVCGGVCEGCKGGVCGGVCEGCKGGVWRGM